MRLSTAIFRFHRTAFPSLRHIHSDRHSNTAQLAGTISLYIFLTETSFLLENDMNRDQVKGGIKDAVGKVQEGVGRTTGNGSPYHR